MTAQDLPTNIRKWSAEALWWIKNTVTYSPPPVKWPLRSTRSMERFLSSTDRSRVQELTTRYDMSRWVEACNRWEYTENLYLLDVLDRYVKTTSTSQCLDIGAKSWSYLPALHSFTQTAWDGVELDCYQRHWNMVTRRAYAEYISRHFNDSRYIPGSLLDISEEYDFITWILPFVTPGPLEQWGLPSRYYQPAQLLQHAWGLLKPGGSIFIINQGEKEGIRQRKLFAEAKISARYLGSITSRFSPFINMRVGWLAHKPVIRGTATR
ncbi:MAG: hypothetical protein OEW08_08475 [Gammaproteobacteria bacterium]|nr:hypothetical protein [Gammaproteobacteria bacterium]